MEFFEQAHMLKCGESSSSKKGLKSEETKKKKIKQMLYGYQKHDNELIKRSMDIKSDFDDSSSVSGFSDLDLSESSSVGDTTRATIGSAEENDSILDELDEEDTIQIANMSLNSDIESTCEDPVTGRVSPECEEFDFDTHSKSSQDEVSLISCSLKTLSDTGSSQDFDPDGLLASRIHEKLKTKKESLNQTTKRKLDETTEVVVPQKVKPSDSDTITKLPLVLHPKLLEEGLIPTFESSESNDTKSSTCSLPYVSISASDVPLNFDDVLGQYKHSTIKNIPFDNEFENLICSENDSSYFSANIVTIAEVDMEEEITDINISEKPSMIETESQSEDLEFIQETAAHETIINTVDYTLQSEDVSEELPKYNLKDLIRLFFKGNTCVCIMKHPAKMFVHGKFKVRALGGTVEVFGHRLTQKSDTVYAPYYNFAQCLSTVESDNTYYGLFGKLTCLGLNVTDAEEIATSLGEHDGVLVLEPLKSSQMNFVEQFFSVANLFSKASKNVDYCHAKALERIGCCIYLTQPRKTFEVPTCWQEVSKHCFDDQSRGIICGGKGVGKSTCLRYHVNKLLPHGPVVVIDLDIGQCEFTVAGNISVTVVDEPLLGPNFTHLKKPEKTLNLGMINSMDNMKRYVNAVIELITYCASDKQLSSMRWIVNTMGMCNVVGLHYMAVIILHCRPTYLMQIDSENPKKRFDMFLRPQLVASHYDYHRNMRLFENTVCPDNLNYVFILSRHTENPVKNTHSLAPRDERYLNFLAYFSQLPNIQRGGTLLEIVPYEVQLQDLCVYMNVKIPQGTVSQVLNGKIVALCQHNSGSVTKKTYVLANEPLLCHGHGLIRGIDFETETLYVITPMPVESLQKVDALLYADWVPELRGQEVLLPADVAVPYRMPTMNQQKQLMSTPRRRFNPVQLLKMSRVS